MDQDPVAHANKRQRCETSVSGAALEEAHMLLLAKRGTLYEIEHEEQEARATLTAMHEQLANTLPTCPTCDSHFDGQGHRVTALPRSGHRVCQQCANSLLCPEEAVQADSRHLPKTFRLITSLYNETNRRRMREYLSCLLSNLNHPRIASTHIIYDTARDGDETPLLDFIRSSRATISFASGRPSFAEGFALGNSLGTDENIIFCNGDIHFDETLAALDTFDLTGHMLILTRWNRDQRGQLRPDGDGGAFEHGEEFLNGNDSWIFKTPLAIPPGTEDILQGTDFCDFKLIRLATESGLRVIDPAFSVRSIHRHASELRHYETPEFSYVRAGLIPLTTLDSQLLQNITIVLLDDSATTNSSSQQLAEKLDTYARCPGSTPTQEELTNNIHIICGQNPQKILKSGVLGQQAESLIVFVDTQATSGTSIGELIAILMTYERLGQHANTCKSFHLHAEDLPVIQHDFCIDHQAIRVAYKGKLADRASSRHLKYFDRC